MLWFSGSNRYSLVNKDFKTLLDLYLASKTLLYFKTAVAKADATADSELLVETLDNYLQDCNETTTVAKESTAALERPSDPIIKQYQIKTKTIRIYFDSEPVLNVIHPAIAHLASPISDRAIDASFDIYIKDDHLHLFKDAQLLKHIAKKDYHHIQGKFIFHLLCLLHHREETDWIGSFHGSTITDGKTSVLFVGNSGKGKSTLSGLLAHNGFDLLADDVSPMLSEDQCIYHNPLALSVKKGAFAVLQPYIPNFEDLPTVNFNKSKGEIKYVPCSDPERSHYPCKAIILVNYQPEADTCLEPVTIKTALETLIPESWLSPNPAHAKQFMDWLETVEYYQLTYSDTQSVVSTVSKLFKTFRKPS